MENNGRKIEKRHFANLLENIGSIDLASHLRIGFKACGLYPFDAISIAYHRLLKTSTGHTPARLTTEQPGIQGIW